MSLLTIYSDNSLSNASVFTSFDDIEHQLKAIGVQFERWAAQKVLPEKASNDDVLDAYSDSIDRLKLQFSFQTADVITLDTSHPDKAAMREKFLNEHTQ